jgi:hypothetical protein
MLSWLALQIDDVVARVRSKICRSVLSPFYTIDSMSIALVVAIAQRAFVALFIFSLLFMRGAIPNPLYSLWLRNSLFDRLLSSTRLMVDWKLFIGMGPFFHDVQVQVQLVSGKTYTWFLLRDECIGPVRLFSSLSRTTLVFYIREHSFFAEKLCQTLEEHFRREQDPMKSMEVAVVLFNSHVRDEVVSSRGNPCNTDVLFSWRENCPSKAGATYP